ncbi:DUF2147 domain-containing protein [Caulifigura coniformis]|nr:DUF2147 domain-containing protein [Caulifigura coniformis]
MVPYYQHETLDDTDAVIAPALAYAEAFAWGRYQVTISIGFDATRNQAEQLNPIKAKVEAINERLIQANKRRRAPGTQLHEINCSDSHFSTSGQAHDEIDEWMDVHFGRRTRTGGRRAANGRIALRGHGEWRLGVTGEKPIKTPQGDFLLASDEKFGSGGIRLQTIMQDAFDRGIPLHIDWDACRSTKEVPGFLRDREDAVPISQKIDASASDSGKPKSLSDIAASLRRRSLVLLSTPEWRSDVTFTRYPGKEIPNQSQHSLLAATATGLSLSDIGDGPVKLRVKKTVNLDRASPHPSECTTRELLAFNLIHLGDPTAFQQPIAHKYGPIDPQLVIYSRRKDHDYLPAHTNILDGASPLAQFEMNLNVVDDAFAFKRSGFGTNVYANVSLNPGGREHTGFRITETPRWIELFVRVPKTSDPVTFCAQPGFPDGFVTDYNGRWKQHSIPADGKVYSCTVWLRPKSDVLDEYDFFDGFLTTLSLSPPSADIAGPVDKASRGWPLGAELQLLGCRLVDKAPGKETPQLATDWLHSVPLEGVEARDLQQYWWCDSTLQLTADLQVARPASAGTSLRQRRTVTGSLKPGAYSWGFEGAVSPSFFVDAGEQQLSFSIRRQKTPDSDQKPCIGIVAYSDVEVLGEKEIPLDRELTKDTMSFTRPGELKALSVLVRDCPDVTVERIDIIHVNKHKSK